MPTVNGICLVLVVALLDDCMGAAYENRLPGASVQYEFTRAQCEQGAFGQSSVNWFGTLEAATDLLVCRSGNGVQAASGSLVGLEPLLSVGSAAEMIAWIDDEAQCDGLTMELWLEHDFSSSSVNIPSGGLIFQVIFTINPTGPSSDGCDIPDFSLLLAKDGKFYLRYRVDGNSCQDFVSILPAVTASSFMHLVLSLDLSSGILSCYQNGALVASLFVIYPTDFVFIPPVMKQVRTFGSQWRSESRLHMFSDKTAVSGSSMEWGASVASFVPWPGTIHLMAMYGHTVSNGEVLQNYQSGLPNSSPVASNATVLYPEDGCYAGQQACPHTAALDLEELQLPAPYDADTEVNHPNYLSSQGASYFLASIPDRGDLFDVAGNPITADSLPYNLSSNILRYRPLGNESSAPTEYTSFDYFVSDGIDLSNTATVSIVIEPQNDEPIALDTVATAQAGVLSRICVEGYDIDTGDAAVSASVKSLPAHGPLLTADGLSPLEVGDVISDLCFGYRYDGEIGAADALGLVANDSFLFSVVDQSGYQSLPGTALIDVYSGISAGFYSPSDNNGTVKVWKVFEDTDTLIQLYAHYEHGDIGPIRLVLSEDPLYGSLWDPLTGLRLESGSSPMQESAYPYEDGIDIISRSLPNYFSSPGAHWNGTPIASIRTDSFSYYPVSANDEASRGADAYEELMFVNVNDATGLECPTDYLSVRAIGTSPAPDGEGQVDELLVAGFDVTDLDLEVDIVRVNVTSKYGLISLNPAFVGNLDFNSASFCFAQGNALCQGSGSSDGSMAFLGTPSDVKMALDGLKYQTYTPAVKDTVIITIYDGAGGQCLASQKFKGKSARPGCLISSCSFEIDVAPLPADADATISGSIFRLPQLPLQLWIGLVVAFIFALSIIIKVLLYWNHKAPTEAVAAKDHPVKLTHSGSPTALSQLVRKSQGIGGVNPDEVHLGEQNKEQAGRRASVFWDL